MRLIGQSAVRCGPGFAASRTKGTGAWGEPGLLIRRTLRSHVEARNVNR